MLTEQEVLDFCNTVRTAGGADILDSLLPGIPLNSKACLIANNLNFDCRIEPESEPGDYDGWNMILDDTIRNTNGEVVGHTGVDVLSIAEKIRDATGMFLDYDMSTSDEAYLNLNPELAEVAHAFDEAHQTQASFRSRITNAYIGKEDDVAKRLEATYSRWLSEFEYPYLLQLDLKGAKTDA